MMNAPPSDEAPAEGAAPLGAERAPHLLLAGSIALAYEVQQDLPGDWQITVVNADAGEPEPGNDGQQPVRVVRADPTSALVLDRAGASGARALFAALPDTTANLEICQIGRDRFHLPKILALVPSAADAAPFRELDVDVVVDTTVVAAAARNLLEVARVVGEVGLGQGEILEITLQPSSPSVGRRLHSFRMREWTIAAIFRAGGLLVPRPETILEAGDRLLLVGEPARLGVIAEYLSAGGARFPMPHGDSIAGVVWGTPSEPFLREVAYFGHGVGLAEVSLTVCGPERDWRAMAEKIYSPVALRWAATSLDPSAAVSDVLTRLQPGCLAVSSSPPRRPRPFAGLAGPLERALREGRGAVFVPRGSFPYERILLPVQRVPLAAAAAQAAFDIAEQLNAVLTTVHVQAPAVLGGSAEEAVAVAAAVEEVAAARRRMIRHERRVGNPLDQLGKLSSSGQLVVLSHRPGRRWRNFRPDVSAYLTQRLSDSVLVLPVDT